VAKPHGLRRDVALAAARLPGPSGIRPAPSGKRSRVIRVVCPVFSSSRFRPRGFLRCRRRRSSRAGVPAGSVEHSRSWDTRRCRQHVPADVP
jgi:hypothetical protein